MTRKVFGTELGLSCAFRQWRADSHCAKLHGYALGFTILLQATSLNDKNWVYDFGDFKWLKAFLQDHFDHKTVVAQDDPYLTEFQRLQELGIVDLIVLENVGCEKFAEFVFNFISDRLKQTHPLVTVLSVECFEHKNNASRIEL